MFTRKELNYLRDPYFRIIREEDQYIEVAPHLLLPLYMKEETERELALFMNMVFLGKMDELWVFGSTASPGMRAEINQAKKHHKTIRYFDNECRETFTEI